MKNLIVITVLLISPWSVADEKYDVARKYFEYLFYEDQVGRDSIELIVGQPIASSFYSKRGHRMIIVSAALVSGRSYFTLMSVNERGMGYLAWKQRGYGNEPAKDVEFFMKYDGEDFDFDGW